MIDSSSWPRPSSIRSRRRSARSSWSGTLRQRYLRGGRVATTCAWCGMWRIARCVAATCRYGMVGSVSSTGWSGAVTRSLGSTFSVSIGSCGRGTGSKAGSDGKSANAAVGRSPELRQQSNRLQTVAMQANCAPVPIYHLLIAFCISCKVLARDPAKSRSFGSALSCLDSTSRCPK